MILAHDDRGSGQAVVLLHAGVCDRRMWDAQAEALATSYRIIAPDLRGFGATPLPPGRFAFAEDVVVLLDFLHVERCALVGSSLGGRVALELAVTHPGRVASLLLLCPAFRGAESTPSAEAFEAEEDRLLSGGDVDAAVELSLTTWLGPEATDACRDRFREMQRHAYEVALAAFSATPAPELIPVEVDPTSVQAPTLVVSGNRDMDQFRAIADHLAHSIPAARLHQLPWAAHLPSLERPDEVTELIRDFLAGIDS